MNDKPAWARADGGEAGRDFHHVDGPPDRGADPEIRVETGRTGDGHRSSVQHGVGLAGSTGDDVALLDPIAARSDRAVRLDGLDRHASHLVVEAANLSVSTR